MPITREMMPKLGEIADEARQRVQEARLAQSGMDRDEKLILAQKAMSELKAMLAEDEHA